MNIEKFNRIKNCEFILINDSFRKPSSLSRLKKKYESHNIHCVEVSKGNPGETRNAGIEIASGDWISFIDSDDFVEFSGYVDLVEKAQLAGADFAVGQYVRMLLADSGLTKTFVPSNQDSIEQLARDPGIWRMCFRRDLISANRFTPMRMAEDQVFLLNLEFWKHKALFSRLPIYSYRTGVETQLTQTLDAFDDIKLSIGIFFDYLFNVSQERDDRKIVSIMLSSQLISVFRRKPFKGPFLLAANLLRVRNSIRFTRTTLFLMRILIIEFLGRSRNFLVDKGNRNV
ncbi:glycosyltransferase [Candidatus Planktophila versatilis]|uniref:Glycosyltransferase n=1 Tax=Candidatus Planktophila versatilis TaxID=1884905 RepID=A0ABM6MCV5_9ACTN|nr:glycosyltransferase [Candidatus Planktophila versatilis]